MSAETSFWPQAISMLMILSIFYVLVIRPGRVAEGNRFRAVRRLRGGERVVTAAGMHGTVVWVDHERGDYEVELCEGVRITLTQKGIVEVRGSLDDDEIVRVEEAARHLAAEIGAPLPGLAVVAWAGGTDGSDSILVLHRPDRKEEAAKAPSEFLGYTVRNIETAALAAPVADAPPATDQVAV